MKNRMYPTWDIIDNFHNPLTEGENKLAHFLDDTLPEEWMIFVEPYLNGSRPDIVILNPQVGVMIYEVKDWDLRHYNFKDEQLFVSDSRGSHLIKDPVKQVNHYKMKIIEQLVPTIGEAIDENNSIFGLIKTCLYFHKASGEYARNFYGDINFPVIIGYDDLHDANMKKILPFSDKKYMQNDWGEEIKWWLDPPFHSKEQTRDIELTPKQKEHAEPQPGHFRLKGPAGSGKTLIIADRAAKLASQGFRVLVITYNITLWHYVKDMIARAPYDFDWRNISFNHFHGFCKDNLNELGIPSPTKESYFNEITQTIENALEIANQNEMDIESLKFDAILIDEGQDYEWDWYNCLCNFLTNRDELLLVCDKKQNIYGRNLGWIDGNMKNVKFRGRWRELKSVHRLPKKIGVATNRFSKLFGLDQSVEVEDYVQLKLTERPPKPHIVWKNIQIKDWLPHIKNAYETVKSEQLKLGEGHPSDIVILIPNNDRGLMAAKNFIKENIEINHVFEDDHEKKYHRNKKSFWSGDSRLKISTIHSFKGWEALHVILLIPEKWNLGYLDSLVYTAMTRTRENLIVLNCNDRYIDYGKSLPSEWDVQ